MLKIRTRKEHDSEKLAEKKLFSAITSTLSQEKKKIQKTGLHSLQHCGWISLDNLLFSLVQVLLVNRTKLLFWTKAEH